MCTSPQCTFQILFKWNRFGDEKEDWVSITTLYEDVAASRHSWNLFYRANKSSLAKSNLTRHPNLLKTFFATFVSLSKVLTFIFSLHRFCYFIPCRRSKGSAATRRRVFACLASGLLFRRCPSCRCALFGLIHRTNSLEAFFNRPGV